MAVMMTMHWAGVTPLQYDELRARVGWLETPPDGGHVHVAGFGDDGLRITDVWDSVGDFRAFVAERLNPVAGELGLTTAPTVEIVPLHELHALRSEVLLPASPEVSSAPPRP